ncbi:MAG TPA: hypothetical protein VI954_00535, partial [Candidatus Paceibacterota bacterium]
MAEVVLKLVRMGDVLPQDEHLELRVYIFEQKARQAFFPNPSQGNVAENIAEIAERPDLRRLSRVDAILPKLYILVKPPDQVMDTARGINAVGGVREYPLGEHEIEIPTPGSQSVPQSFPVRPKARTRTIKVSLPRLVHELPEESFGKKNIRVNEEKVFAMRRLYPFVPPLSRMPTGNDPG